MSHESLPFESQLQPLNLPDFSLSEMSDYTRYRRAQTLFETKSYREAAEELEILLGTADALHGLDDARLLLARSYYHSAQLNRAEKLTRTILDERPEDGWVALLLARILQRSGRSPEAEPYLNRARVLGEEI
ncbi:tetratricopeptide repeat protein [Kribbia dieselivorans]|uniref:tetratricopeptide repeat protein n=1 Tax=Kribbia dieselivorans TaxID=331526 RepID=UPI0008395280|nr:tetratricopeptide repeat protein [Kribbia dieselivorans]